ncbi:DUF4167 domain-containing protein [Alphaproteobacteria bacterium]|nr:DUF4167 domain-containing protein [Alphaproteobacteria bacterium]
MRQQNNGRRRQNRGSNRRNFGNNSFNGNLNKNTVIDSAGPDGRQRGSVSQLTEKYNSLASDAASSDDRILAESFLQFADHYYRLQKEIEINNEVRETKKNETQSPEDAVIESDINKNDKRPSRRKRGFQIRENELKETENIIENSDLNENKKNENTDSNNLLV